MHGVDLGTRYDICVIRLSFEAVNSTNGVTWFWNEYRWCESVKILTTMGLEPTQIAPPFSV